MLRAAGVFAPLVVWLGTVPPGATETIKIGCIYPLTGNAASAGPPAKAAVELAAEIVNGPSPELKDIPLAEAAGLPHLGGAKIEPINADHQGNPSVGQNQTLRLITHIDRAGSGDPAKIQHALRQTDLKPSQLVIGYNGVRFHETGQNILSAT
jgi:hypothetical protein